MIEGAANTMSLVHGLRAQGQWPNPPGENDLDGGCPFYDTYACSDGRFIAVGALEPQFYSDLIQGLGLQSAGLPAQWDRAGWPELRAAFTTRIAQHPREYWADRFATLDACVTSVLEMDEVAGHPHVRARGSFVTDPVSGTAVPGPAPRFGPRCGTPN
jgi:alpha-methylacyl-CoA racemase